MIDRRVFKKPRFLVIGNNDGGDGPRYCVTTRLCRVRATDPTIDRLNSKHTPSIPFV